ncbi:putative multidrug resistance transporter, Bcr/CflA family [uncultured Pleomorphomonas sp.]|uniref:Bcr/CflA family efflux transporter n=1 Tax=uncultured Pleomorphomonas sp. TaxID=442121 RepID=A0A212LNT0_9HYPH|nr:multidrug effflux MFS transporter [uncultured Pleomorphomonas sp.]SCM79205.1 putative multidrug resistance transporter, Bcr/CflA family [uncultured Pleomorphomonas sp.]
MMQTEDIHTGGKGERPIGATYLALILAGLTSFAPFATDMYLASFPELARVFATDLGSVQLSLSLFSLGLAVGQVFYGPLIDRFGRKLPMMVGVGLFTVTSLLIVMAPTIDVFIGLRFLQAIGGCAGMIISRAIIADLFKAHEAAKVLSLMMLVQGLAPILAPIAGGYVLIAAGWQAIFIFLALYGAACLAAVRWGLPETLAADQRRREHPLHVLRAWVDLLGTRTFVVPAATGALAFGSSFAFISGSSFVYMDLHGVGEGVYGWLFGLNAVGMIVAIQINRWLLGRLSAGTILNSVFLLFLGLSCLLMATADRLPLFALVAMLFVCLGCVPVIGANTVAIAMEATGAHRGSGSAILGITQFAMASLTSAGVGLLHDGTALPMTGIIFACALAATLIWFLGGRWREAKSASTVQ